MEDCGLGRGRCIGGRQARVRKREGKGEGNGLEVGTGIGKATGLEVREGYGLGGQGVGEEQRTAGKRECEGAVLAVGQEG